MKEKVKYTDFDEHIQEVLSKMCEMVGTKIEDIDFNDEEWYYTHTWTDNQQEEFKKWLVDYLHKKHSARKLLTMVRTKDKKLLEKAASSFIFNYGWKVNNNGV